MFCLWCNIEELGKVGGFLCFPDNTDSLHEKGR